GQAGEPAGVHLPHVVGYGLRFLGLGTGIRVGLLLGQLTRMHHDKTERLHANPSIAVLDLNVADDALPMPATGRFRCRPPRFLYEEGQSRLLLPPGFEFLTHGARAWH